MDSPCRRPERAVVADAAVVLLHAVVVVRSIVRNLDTSVLMNCGCLSHHFQPRLLCSLRRWPCTHHPLLFASQAHNLTHNSKLKWINFWRILLFSHWYHSFHIRSLIKIANGQGISIYRCTNSSRLTFHGKECYLNPKLKLLILISHSMPFTLYQWYDNLSFFKAFSSLESQYLTHPAFPHS